MTNNDYGTHGIGQLNQGQEEFENLYGPLEEHMYFESPDYTYLHFGHPYWINPDNVRNRLTIVAVFKLRAEETFNGFLEKQKAGKILSKEELAAKKQAYLALCYVKGHIAELEGEKKSYRGKAHAAYR